MHTCLPFRHPLVLYNDQPFIPSKSHSLKLSTSREADSTLLLGDQKSLSVSKPYIMAGSFVLKLTCLVLACMMVGAPIAQAALSCGTVQSNLVGCISYLRTGKGLTSACCGGVRALNNAAQTTPDRQAACECIKKASASISGINPSFAAGLPGKCGVNIPYKISTSTNCKA